MAETKNYDCMKCPGYCCAYPLIQITNKDLKRLAAHLGKTVDETRSSFTVLENPTMRRIKLTADTLFKSKSCIFLDKKTRQCTVYEGRPHICREHPGDRCEWYDRRRIEKAISRSNGSKAKVILLKAMPWTVESDHPLYTEERVSHLLESYASGNGLEPGEEPEENYHE